MNLLDRVRAAVAPTYVVEREIGRGGTGVVFLATDPTLARRGLAPAKEGT